MDTTLHHTRLEKGASGVWGILTALDDWMGGPAHSRRYRERKVLQEAQSQNNIHTLVV